MKKNWKKIVLFLCISILLELVVFNYRSLFSMFASNQRLELQRQANVVIASGMSGEPGYLYVGVESYTDNGEALPVSFTISIQDEGNSDLYQLAEVSLYTLVEKSKYLAVHSYGDVEAMHIILDEERYGMPIWVNEVIFDARVPWFVSVPRILIVFVLLCLIRYLWHAYHTEGLEWKKWNKRLAVSLFLLINIGVFFFMVTSNTAFLEPVWPYHQQYQKLAESLSRGEVTIDVGDEAMRAALLALDNPYDFNLRMQTVPNAGQIWDICYYQGDFYVYFGIVPVLIFYLPYYLLFHENFPTWIGVFLAACGALSGVYYLLGTIRRRWFPKMNYVWYLFLSFIVGNGLNMYCALLHADFYYFPIILALCFSLWGLGLIISAVDNWDRQSKGYVVPRLAAGALCLALTAGCRPQFLVGSFLIIPVLQPVFFRKRQSLQERGKSLKRVLAIALPYVIIAAGLMYYNFIRFGSVFDFGANYNLTTNDMTHRGFQLGRLPDGIFMYLFQPINFQLKFPFAAVTYSSFIYLGETIADWLYGGVFWTHAILLILVLLPAIWKDLKRRQIFGFTVVSIAMAVVVVLADTEMSGILTRYTTDFLWLLMLPAAIIIFQMIEKWKGTQPGKWLFVFILIAGFWGIFYEMGIAIVNSELINNNVHRYYMINSLFQ